uniref:Uncharacterized protein n=1 Tax=Chrysotila carterae TaxID=13221 RepID=A0A7S4FBC6_CHRCT|mmetsp:Transcript_4751/g.10302  ORF Transcript_4751/g.10302 Transcript_4751/m.10302 type:complete len:214 (+) Transcript_4751:270-911(+)
MSTSEAENLRMQGNTAIQKGDASTAATLYTEALQLEPDNHLLLSNRSLALLRLGKDEEACADARRCVCVCPEWPKGHSRLGAALYSLGKHAEAVKAYEAALALSPDDTGVKAALEDAKQAAARSSIEAQLRPAVLDFAARKQAASALLSAGKFAEAAKEYEGALRAMDELLGKLPERDANPMRDAIGKLREQMYKELVAAKSRKGTQTDTSKA